MKSSNEGNRKRKMKEIKEGRMIKEVRNKHKRRD
jgi:hypothetical protein